MAPPSPGKVTSNEIMEILFGYLVFAGFDKLSSLLVTAFSPKEVTDDGEKKEKAMHVFQFLGIIIAVGVLFWYKFRV